MPGANQRCTRRVHVPRPHQQTSPPVALQLVDVHFLEQAPLVNDADALGQARDFAQDVARHQDRDALLMGQFEQQLADLDDARRVQTVGRLVQDEQLRAVQEGFGQPQTLRVAQREHAGAPVGIGSQPQTFDHVADGLRRLCRDAGGGRPPDFRKPSIPDRRAASPP